jgi:glycosyltransferase involved in cell wall biosynthesis
MEKRTKKLLRIWRDVLNDTFKLSGRVGMLVHSYYLRDPRVRRAAEELAAVGVEVHVVCIREPIPPDGTREPKQETVKGVNIYRVCLSRKRGGKFRYYFEFAAITILGMLKLTQLHIKRKFDVIHIHNMPDILVFAGMIPKFTGTTIVLDVHDPMSELFQLNYHMNGFSPLMRALKAQERISYKFANHLITVSHPMAENIAQKIGCDKHNITVVQNLPDLNNFPIRDTAIRWPRHEESFVVLYAGTITEHYRLDIAVQAIAIASKKIPTLCFRILGEGNRLQQVLDLAKELRISNRVEHLKPVSFEAVKDIMADADVGISTHQASAFGDLYFSNKLLEFLSQGLPVVTSKTKTVARYLPDDVVFFFEPENPDQCAQQLISIWNNPNLVIQKLEKARTLAQRLNWQEERKNLIGFYKKLLIQ